jgi:hypothetical protein
MIYSGQTKKMKLLKRSLTKKIKRNLPDFSQKKTNLGLWGSEQIRKLNFLDQEMVLMKMD